MMVRVVGIDHLMIRVRDYDIDPGSFLRKIHIIRYQRQPTPTPRRAYRHMKAAATFVDTIADPALVRLRAEINEPFRSDVHPGLEHWPDAYLASPTQARFAALAMPRVCARLAHRPGD